MLRDQEVVEVVQVKLQSVHHASHPNSPGAQLQPAWNKDEVSTIQIGSHIYGEEVSKVGKQKAAYKLEIF